MYKETVEFIRKIYNQPDGVVPLHAPVFMGNEKKYLLDCIDSTFVSYVGKYVNQFEGITAKYTGAKYAVATVNGTTALQIALMVSGVEPGDEVLTQSLTFVATANAIRHANAFPVFVDVDKDTLGLSPEKLNDWIFKNTTYQKQTRQLVNNQTGRAVKAIVPVHTFGHPCRIDEIVEIAQKYNLIVVEDAAESLGSFYKNQHTGTFGNLGILSYNGNKTITTGGGGMIITDDKELARKAKHITTTAKVPHSWEFVHDEIGYNYRLTNLSAAIGVAQMEQLDLYIQNKRDTASVYKTFFDNLNIQFIAEPGNSKSNYWLNAILLQDKKERDGFLEYSNRYGVMTRPVWALMSELPMFSDCQCGNIENSRSFVDRLVNIPSSFRK